MESSSISLEDGNVKQEDNVVNSDDRSVSSGDGELVEKIDDQVNIDKEGVVEDSLNQVVDEDENQIVDDSLDESGENIVADTSENTEKINVVDTLENTEKITDDENIVDDTSEKINIVDDTSEKINENIVDDTSAKINENIVHDTSEKINENIIHDTSAKNNENIVHDTSENTEKINNVVDTSENTKKINDEENIVEDTSDINQNNSTNFLDDADEPELFENDDDQIMEYDEEEVKDNDEEEPARRPSIVSTTEIVTSPGGTRSLKVGIAPKGVIKRKSSSTQEELKNAFADISKKEDFFVSNTSENDIWQGGVSDFDEDALLAEQLAADMEKEHEREEQVLEMSNNINEYKIEKQVKMEKTAITESKKESPQPQVEHGTIDHELLLEKDKQIEALQDQLMRALRGEAGVVDGIAPEVGVDKRDAKIVSLAKKTRSLNLALDREKGKVKQLQTQVEELMEDNKRLNARKQIEAEAKATKTMDISNNEQQQINNDKAQLSELQVKFDELKRKNENQQNENKKLKRVLLKEIGGDENLSTEKLLEMTQEDGWRGRSQKILLLKDKLKRANAYIDQMKSKQHEFGEQQQQQQQQQNGNRRTFDDSKINVDAQAEQDIRTIERERRHAMEKLATEYEQLESQLSESKRISSAIKARSKVLENENKRYKEQVKILLSKTNNDDALVEAQRRELDRLRRDCSNFKQQIKSLEKGTTSTMAFEELKQHAQSQSVQIERQGQLLVRMKEEMERIKLNASQDIVSKAHEELDIHAYSVNNKLLKVENERLGELVDLFKRKLERAVLDRESAISKAKIVEKQKVELERKLGNIKTGGRKRQPLADQFSELRDKLALQVEENRSLRASATQTINQKDEEIKILREMGGQVKSAYERAISEMKRQVQHTAIEAQKRLANTETKVDEALLCQLTNDNQYLREELSDIRNRTSPVHSKSMTSFDSPQKRNRRLVRSPNY